MFVGFHCSLIAETKALGLDQSSNDVHVKLNFAETFENSAITDSQPQSGKTKFSPRPDSYFIADPLLLLSRLQFVAHSSPPISVSLTRQCVIAFGT